MSNEQMESNDNKLIGNTREENVKPSELDSVNQEQGAVKKDGGTRSDESFVEEDAPFPPFHEQDEIWDPPEADIMSDDVENSMTILDDEDADEYADTDSSEWATPRSKEKQLASQKVKNGRFKDLVSQLLGKVGVVNCDKGDENWVDIVSDLAWQAAKYVKPGATEGRTMDPSGYVKIKCVAAGSHGESRLFKGLVFKKHAAHKHMTSYYKNPKLLLIQGMLGPSSVSSKLSSFSSMITEDQNFDDLIKNLQASQPNVILVEKSASRAVMEKILEMGGTLVLDMKINRLKRVAHCTQSPILSSDEITNQTLRHCDSLYFEKFVEEHAVVGEGGKKPFKTLMFIEGCPTRLGCTILLKGSHGVELKKIKSVVQCAVVMAYHLLLETSFLVDQNAMFSTIAIGEASDTSLTEEQSTSAVCESGEPNVRDSSEDSCVQQTNDQDIPVSHGLQQEEPSHVKELTAEDNEVIIPSRTHDVPDNMELEADSSSTVCCESRMTTLSAASSSFSQVMEKVSVVSPATYENMSTYIDLNGRESEAKAGISISVSPPEDLVENHASEGKSIFNDPQSWSTSTSADGESKEPADDDESKNPADDISTVLESESILILMSIQNALKGTICKQTRFSHIKFYRNFDVPLEKFLRDNLFNQAFKCQTCSQLPEAHVYYYAHHSKQLTIRVKQLKKPLPRESEGKLWMWSRCSKCEPDKNKATKRVIISTVARRLSFGKFLELSFSCQSYFNRLANCGHCFQKDFLYFFGLGSMGAMLQYSRVRIYDVSVPSQKLKFNSSIQRDWLQPEISKVYSTGVGLFNELEKYLMKIEPQFSGWNLVLNGFSIRFTDVFDMLRLERSHFEENFKNKNEDIHEPAFKVLRLNRLRWEILLEACVWERRLQSLLSSSPTLPQMTTTDAKESLNESKGSIDLPSNLHSDGESTRQDTVSLSSHLLETRSIPIKADDEIASDGEVSKQQSSPMLKLDSQWWVPFEKTREECLKDLVKGRPCKIGYLPKFKLLHSPEFLTTVSQVIIEEGSRLHMPLVDGTFIVSDFDGEISSSVSCALAFTDVIVAHPASESYKNTTLKCIAAEPWALSSSLDPAFIHSESSMSFTESHLSRFGGSIRMDSHISYGLNQHEVTLGIEKNPLKGKYSVVIIYPNEFRNLRDRCCPSELDYIASLNRCKIWDAKGGKSKSVFAKTLDDRFIVKEIKKIEFDSFMKFARSYFDYMKKCVDAGNQTCLAKILGIYQVTIRNPKGGKETKHDIVVQENLSFGRNIIRQYDLKGALYARFTEAADDSGDVLLDQNFVDDMNSSPLYVGLKAKRLLQRAIWNDTSFLNEIGVMDYSLLVGVDSQQHELICGIIDYLRKYTWDKHLETLVKSSLVVPKNTKPTIISPQEYKKRFRKFMDTHFLTVPDHWCSRRSSNPCSLCGSKSLESAAKPSEKLDEELQAQD